MSLATRCTACSTVFRVVQDHLKVSEGWVRCGRCNEVFNALEGLFDLERDAPPQGAAEPPPAVRPLPEQRAREPWEIDEGAAEFDLVDKIDAQLLSSRRREDGSTPATRISQRDRLEFPDARFDPALLVDETVSGALEEFVGLPVQAAAERDAEPVTPGFVQRARREARWRSAGMRSALVGTGIALLLTLGLQVGHHFRDLAAAQWPTVRPGLAAWCGWMSCAVEPPRRIEDVLVESSSLARASAPDAFRLSLTLRNRGVLTVALPSVDLNLTDPVGQLVARRVLRPADFRAASTLLPAGAESALQVVLTAGDARISGYTVEVFYP